MIPLRNARPPYSGLKAKHRQLRERNVTKFKRLYFKTLHLCSKDGSGSCKDNWYTYNHSSGHTNHSPPNITTSTITTKPVSTTKTTATTSKILFTSVFDHTKTKLVKILSFRPLTKASPLARGTNFTVVPQYYPKGQCITIIENLLKLPQMAEDLWAETSIYSTPNITSLKTLKELRHDKNRVILTVDKGLAMLVLDKQEYINKAKDHLVESDMYRPLTADPTNKHKSKLINMFRTIKAEGELGEYHI